jgi:hypothetical protein
VTLVLLSSHAYADDASPNVPAQGIPSVAQLEAQFQFQLTTRQEPYGQPKATSYYDDLEDHYEQVQLMRDVVAQDIP